MGPLQLHDEGDPGLGLRFRCSGAHEGLFRAQRGVLAGSPRTGEGALELSGEGGAAGGPGAGPPLAAELLRGDRQQRASRRAHAHQRPDRRVPRQKLVRLRQPTQPSTERSSQRFFAAFYPPTTRAPCLEVRGGSRARPGPQSHERWRQQSAFRCLRARHGADADAEETPASAL